MVNTKSFEYEVKDVDIPAGVVDIYVNAYGNVDSDGDISAEGSFTKTVKENFKRIKHFYNHDSTILLGLPLEFPNNNTALQVRSRMNVEKSFVKDVISDYRLFKDNGRTLEHSIGFNVIKRDEKNKAIITEYKLWEYSTLSSFGANENTPFLGLKSKEAILQRMSDLVLMYNQTYSDNRLKQIEQALNTLANMKPDLSEGTTLVIEPPKDDAQLIKSFREGLKLT